MTAADKHFSPEAAASDITEKDWAAFTRLTSVELSAEESAQAALPQRVDNGAEEFLAVHWHPEWIPLNLVAARLAKAFPNAKNSLAIPTQHNKILALGQWAGVEADVYDRAYGQKVQLLIHFRAEKMERAKTFISMMERTYNYRAHQLLDILRRLAEAEALPPPLKMARFYAIRLNTLIEASGILGSERDELLKNRLLPDFMAARLPKKHKPLLEQALLYIKAVKKSVKAELNPAAFYSPQEVIEEARSLGAGVVIPHPPLFWPILLSNLDVDGWEIWNTGTPDQAVFLAEALGRANGSRRGHKLLAFMGDDTHMSAKIRPSADGKKAPQSPEIGFQDAWGHEEVAKILAKSGQSRTNTINEYRARLLA